MDTFIAQEENMHPVIAADKQLSDLDMEVEQGLASLVQS